MSTTTTITVRYFAAARSAAGVEAEPLEVPPGATLADALAAVRDRHGGELARVLDRCSFLLDEVSVRDRTTPLTTDATLDVLPPFAGG
ncbi:MAG: MoaD/ThiS family protein [Pseudonocardia sp.]